MATIDLTVNLGIEPLGAVEENFIYERVIDFSDKVNQMVVGDLMHILKIPAGMHIIGSKIDVLKVQGAAAFFNFGTVADPNEYIDNINANVIGATISGDAAAPEPASMRNNGKYITAEETLTIAALGSLNAGKIRVSVYGFDLRLKSDG